jgi:hypothetical protein
MKISVSLVIQSQLSDAIIETTLNPKTAAIRLQFIKQILMTKSSSEKISEKKLDEIWKAVNKF